MRVNIVLWFGFFADCINEEVEATHSYPLTPSSRTQHLGILATLLLQSFVFITCLKFYNFDFVYRGGGGNLYFRLDIILVKGLSKHTLNTYFLSMKKDPKYAFLHAFFLIC